MFSNISNISHQQPIYGQQAGFGQQQPMLNKQPILGQQQAGGLSQLSQPFLGQQQPILGQQAGGWSQLSQGQQQPIFGQQQPVFGQQAWNSSSRQKGPYRKIHLRTKDWGKKSEFGWSKFNRSKYLDHSWEPKNVILEELRNSHKQKQQQRGTGLPLSTAPIVPITSNIPSSTSYSSASYSSYSAPLPTSFAPAPFVAAPFVAAPLASAAPTISPTFRPDPIGESWHHMDSTLTSDRSSGDMVHQFDSNGNIITDNSKLNKKVVRFERKSKINFSSGMNSGLNNNMSGLPLSGGNNSFSRGILPSTASYTSSGYSTSGILPVGTTSMYTHPVPLTSSAMAPQPFVKQQPIQLSSPIGLAGF